MSQDNYGVHVNANQIEKSQIAVGNNVKQEQNNTDQSRHITITGETVTVSGAAAFSQGDISGIVANSINQLPTSSEPDKPGIKERLEQLKAVIETEPNLSEKDKTKALKQVQAIAEAGKTADKGAIAEIVDDATTMLKGITVGLPAATNLVAEFHKLIPLITSFFV